MKIKEIIVSKDNITKKYIQETIDGFLTETVYVDYSNKHIICYSSQVGCKIGCSMCYNGINKNFSRNLTKEEIVKQCENIVEDLKINGDSKPILFSCMGVGEPLLNYENVTNAIKIINQIYPNNKYALSTTGVQLSLILDLASSLKEIENFKLMISLHGSNQKTRELLIPLKTDLFELVDTVKEFQKISFRETEWNYVLFDNVNDKEENAYELINLLGKDSKVKLNCYNPVNGCNLISSRNYNLFSKILTENGLNNEVYQTDGSDINSACGQMAGNKRINNKV